MKLTLINELFSYEDSHIGERGDSVDVSKFVKKAKKGDKEALLQLIMDERDTYYRLAYPLYGQ
ncbi:hypothetical protein [Radiobacillus sp. PE A8.2]|uniref:hypothetical protein n=1 Tax=Radiobacillus sp. PE A8.2 TaxID=3380349 RepID=UPI00388E472B